MKSVISVVVVFGLFVVMSGGVRLSQIYLAQKFVYRIAHLLSMDLLWSILGGEYMKIRTVHSSKFHATSEKIALFVVGVLNPMINLVASFVISAGIFVSLFLVDSTLALSAIGFLGIFYGCVGFVLRRALFFNSRRINESQDRRSFLLGEALAGYREILMVGAESTFLKNYSKADLRLRRAQVVNILIGTFPRYVLESLAILFALIFLVSYRVLSGGDFGAVIPVLTAFAFGGQKLLPHLQMIYSSASSVLGNKHVAQEVLSSFSGTSSRESWDRVHKDGVLEFSSSISLSHVSFRYPGHKRFVFEDFSLEIKKREKLVIVGASGSGKSTLVDILTGHLEPEKGLLLLDGEPLAASRRSDWIRSISYVPQQSFLLDGSLYENLMFERADFDTIDQAIVEEILERLDLAEWVRSLPNGLNHLVGQQGVRISGGQRQRIALARSLLSSKAVLILDECTSALDAVSESKAVSAVLDLASDKTVVFITHRAVAANFFERSVDLNRPGAVFRPLELEERE